MAHRLGIELLSVFGLPPLDFVDLAARLGCACISIGLSDGGAGRAYGYAPYSLRDDPGLRHDVLAALHDTGVAVSLGEGCIIRPGVEMRDYARDMDIFAALGAERLNTVSLDPDLGRSLDQLAVFAEMANDRGMLATVEPCPVLVIHDLASGVDAVRHVGRAGFGLLLDAMHLGRSGATGAEIAALDPAMIGYFQLCDAPRVPIEPNYMVEASSERRRPGDGEMPVRDYLAALPVGTTLSLEVPLKSEADAGIGPEARLRPAVESIRALLADLGRSTGEG